MLAPWIVPVIVTLAVFLLIAVFILMWTLLRTSHRFTPKAKSFADHEKAINEFQSNVLINANDSSQQYVPPQTYVQPQHFQSHQMSNHPHDEMHIHKCCNHQHSKCSHIYAQNDNHQINDQHCCECHA
ncbi:uncharacterized protein cubi_03571 [Cryptosporidium ubiquitum]|uniref:Uncharacterized protein n=1 Tax=Cryptosporidium ubiquitum TaxID=857276 RepID=A0A1J4MLM6_9CRYT|nr:uncharacterized protein cubi_03571 [Cryptosporidium ubiquitum]OII73773.1 hypothetical protein cubi_03571 [Cryptosporidium ubiquitum]